MRSASVSSERPIIQLECESSCVPMAPRSCRIGFMIVSAPIAAPAIRSECPPTYFVSEYTETSAPNGSGRWKTGPSSVLSQTMMGRCFCRAAMSPAIRLTSLISTIVLSGLDGVSIMITDTRPLAMAASAASRMVGSSTPSAKPTAPTP